MDCIKIKGLKVFAYHGVFEKEQIEGQDFYFNITLYTDTKRAGEEDELALSTDYGDVCHKVTEWVTEEKKKLIEAVAEKVANHILLTYPLIKKVRVEVEKPMAPVGLPFDNVSVEIERGWNTCYLSIGSNMGDSKKILDDAVTILGNHPGIQVIKSADYLVTRPYGDVVQDDFLNGALEIRTFLNPEELLEELHKIEAGAGRERIIHWGPRTLDMDIVFYEDLVYESQDLIIPHVDMQNRQFVLEPLMQLCPNKRHPIYHKTVREMYEALSQ